MNAAAEAPRILLTDVTVDLDGRRVLSDVAVDLPQRRIAVIGANGSGKSTLARLLNGLVVPTEGTVMVHGKNVATQTREVRHGVGFIFSNPDAQILMPTVREDVALSLQGSGLTRSEKADVVSATLDEYGLSAHADAPAHSLSGGQKQLLALASVLVRRPALVVADEPTTLLDLGNARRMSDLLLSDIAAQVVIVTHDLDLAARCDVAVYVREGRVDEVGDPAGLIARYRASAR